MTITTEKPTNSVPIYLFSKEEFASWISGASDEAKQWVSREGFTANAGQVCTLPNEVGGLAAVLVGKEADYEARWTLARVAAKLKLGAYHLADTDLDPKLLAGLALSWSLADYAYGKKQAKDAATLHIADEATSTYVKAADKAVRLARRLVSTPTNLMGPADLASEAQVLAANKGGACDVTIGQDLLEKNFPAIHAVGRAAEQARAPRLIDFKWGTSGPKLTLVGKGVCFDTGGLDLKSAGNMRLMKKDMGGAAHVLAVASMVMDLGLPVQLRVLIPAVENSVAGNAFRPGDVIDTRKGISVEVGNTDAEGRLVLADALALACEDTPDLLIDFATLTGAARVALGPDLPAVFTNDDGFAAHIQHASNERLDPTWRLPLHPAYRSAMASNFADTNNISESMPMGGAITAALFLEKFVAEGTTWAHLDVMAYNTRSKPGRPAGGEAMGVLAIYDALKAQLRL